MKRNIILPVCILLLGFLLLGCVTATKEIKIKTEVRKYSPLISSVSELKIKTDVKKYSPLMSSVFGIGMTPEFSTNQRATKVQYHWTTTSGGFIIFENKRKKEVVNYGKKLMWIPFGETSIEATKIIITLKAVDAKTDKMLAETNLTIEKDGLYYFVKPENKTNNIPLTDGEALDLVKQFLGKTPSYYSLSNEGSELKDGKKYLVVRAFENIVDNVKTGESHITTFSWFYVDEQSGDLYESDRISGKLLKPVKRTFKN